MPIECDIHQFSGKFTSEQNAESTGFTGWSDLVMKGYGFEGDTEYRKRQFYIEYGKSKDREILAVVDENIVVGSLVISKTDRFLEERSYGIHGMVVLPDYRKLGLGKKLFQLAIQKFSIDILSGSTKNPAAVAAIASGVRDPGMRTFYGMYEVTSGDNYGVTNDHFSYLESYLEKKESVDIDNPIYYKDTDILLPILPNLEGFNSYIIEAFSPIVEAQRKAGNETTAVMPIISIKEELLI